MLAEDFDWAAWDEWHSVAGFGLAPSAPAEARKHEIISVLSGSTAPAFGQRAPTLRASSPCGRPASQPAGGPPRSPRRRDGGQRPVAFELGQHGELLYPQVESR